MYEKQCFFITKQYQMNDTIHLVLFFCLKTQEKQGLLVENNLLNS